MKNPKKLIICLQFSWNPVTEVLKKLRSELGEVAVFFYNEYTPDLIGCLWRPDAFKGQGFSAMYSEFKRPIVTNWEENSLVISNASDMMRAIQFIVKDIAIDLKILDEKVMTLSTRSKTEKNSSDSNKRKHSSIDSSDDDDESSSVDE